MLKMFLILFFAHCIVDFYFDGYQSDKGQAKPFRHILLHSGLYLLVFGVPLFALSLMPWYWSLLLVIGMGLVNLVIRTLSANVKKKQRDSQTFDFKVFLADQSAHVIIILVFSLLFGPYMVVPAWLHNLAQVDIIRWILKFIFAAAICGKPTGIFIMRLLACFDARPLSNSEDDCEGYEAVESAPDGSGAAIGFLERGIILLLTFLQQYGVIGFVLTAKSVARYKQLEKQAFAEKYLIGTLTSTLIALLVGIGVASL